MQCIAKYKIKTKKKPKITNNLIGRCLVSLPLNSNKAPFNISIFKHGSEAFGSKLQIFKFLLSLYSQKRLRYKENNTKYRGLTWKPWSHVRILIYRMWPIVGHGKLYSVEKLIYVRTKRQKDQNLKTNRQIWNQEVMESWGILQAQKIINHVTVWAIFQLHRQFVRSNLLYFCPAGMFWHEKHCSV